MAARCWHAAGPRAASASRPESGPTGSNVGTGTQDPTQDFRLPQRARVRTRAEFDRVFKEGRRAATPLLALHWLHDAPPSRLGLAVSRKVDPRAVGRNRIKRALRECFRRLRPQLADGAFVVVARNAAAHAPTSALASALTETLQRLGALPLSRPGVTMPPAYPSPKNAPRDRGE